jgi:hypothetical protein
MPQISQAVRDALRDATMTAATLDLPKVDPKVYKECKTLIERTGGKWVRGKGTHVYAEDPRPVIAEIIETGEMPRDADKDAAFWRTPAKVAERVIYYAGLQDPVPLRVLEPSAGDGALAEAARNVYPWRVLDLVCVEPDARRHAVLLGKGFKAEPSTFEEYAVSEPEPFDAVIMNPPFAVAGHPTLWAEHVVLAFGLLRPGGKLAAVVPDNLSRNGVPMRAVRALVKAHGLVSPLPAGAFKASGTGVNTTLLVLTRPDS